jgi:hypothetical protein
MMLLSDSAKNLSVGLSRAKLLQVFHTPQQAKLLKVHWHVSWCLICIRAFQLYRQRIP